MERQQFFLVACQKVALHGGGNQWVMAGASSLFASPPFGDPA
jgi:hypothetical protein